MSAFAALGSDSPRPFRNTPHASGKRWRISAEKQETSCWNVLFGALMQAQNIEI